MRFIFTLNSLGLGGTESYALTVAEQLDRLGHDVSICALELGRGVEAARERGIEVHGPGDVSTDTDVVVAQDGATAYEMARIHPDAKRIVVVHSESFDPQAPPRLDGVAEVAIALNDRVAARLEAFAAGPRVVRMRQPIDTERFLARGALPERPQRALLLSNNQLADREEMLASACAAAGVELTRVGGSEGQTIDPREALSEADLVIGYGRSVLEAMACGRAAFVYDWSGGEGWVTAESYPTIEADGFAGRDETVLDGDDLVEQLRSYDRSMGPVNRDLVVAHHRANVHAQQLVELAGEIGAGAPPPGAPLEEMARLVRLEWRARAESHGLMVENTRLHRRLREASEEFERDTERQRREIELETASAYERTLSWRLTAPLRALQRLFRRNRGG